MQKGEQNRDFVRMADNLWEYMLPRILRLLSSKVGFYRAKVTAKPGDGMLTIQKPFDETEVTLPCVSSAYDTVGRGDQVVVLTFGDDSAAIVIGDGMLTNL